MAASLGNGAKSVVFCQTGGDQKLFWIDLLMCHPLRLCMISLCQKIKPYSNVNDLDTIKRPLKHRGC